MTNKIIEEIEKIEKKVEEIFEHKETKPATEAPVVTPAPAVTTVTQEAPAAK